MQTKSGKAVGLFKRARGEFVAAKIKQIRRVSQFAGLALSDVENPYGVLVVEAWMKKLRSERRFTLPKRILWPVPNVVILLLIQIGFAANCFARSRRISSEKGRASEKRGNAAAFITGKAASAASDARNRRRSRETLETGLSDIAAAALYVEQVGIMLMLKNSAIEGKNLAPPHLYFWILNLR